MSLIASPSRLNPITVMNFAGPGKVEYYQAILMHSRPELANAPHSGVGG
ncbi:hypothetical protein KGY77_10720 [Candidatus Bipolaricaulota bacterium]|nr:hypothetical protein [Candidatus Bipolaricaulota bacterium]